MKLSFSSGKLVNGEEVATAFEIDKHKALTVHRVVLQPADFSWSGNNFANPVTEDYFCDLCTKFRPDYVHCHNLMGLSVNLPGIARRFGAKTIVTLHDYWGVCPIQTLLYHNKVCEDHSRCSECVSHFGFRGVYLPVNLRKGYIRRAFKDVDQFISPSHFLRDVYVKDGVENVDVIRNGVPKSFQVRSRSRQYHRQLSAILES